MLHLLITMQTVAGQPALDLHIVTPDEAAPTDRVVVLMHGFGAPGDDLVALAERLPQRRGLRYVLPQAPLTYGEGRAWWMIDWASRAHAERTGDWRSYGEHVPDGLSHASEMVNALLDRIEHEWNVPPERIVLGGFSQGAMLALDVVARRKAKPRALVLLSGSVIAAARWRGQVSALKGLEVFQSHGDHDNVLPFHVAEALRDELGRAGTRVAWLPFSGGHGIPGEVITALAAFLRE